VSLPSWAITDYVPDWLAPLWVDEPTRLALLFLLAAGLIFIFVPGKPKHDRQLSPSPAKSPRRWHWPFRRKRIPWKLGSVTIDLMTRGGVAHAVVAGMTGTGKSSAVLSLLMGKMSALVVAFDNSRPIQMLFQAMGWTIWQPGGVIGWDVLSGPAQVVSEALTAGFARTQQDTGFYRGMAQERLWQTLDDLDARGRPRTIDALVDALRVKSGNATQDRACLDWSVRFSRIARSLGPSLGTDLDLAECMRHGDKILILPNRFLSPEDAPLIGGIALVQARRVAQDVGNFLLIVEEAGQAGNRQTELNAIAQAGRDRGCPLIVLTQNAAKLSEEVTNNVKVWISFAQESKRELTFAAEHLRIDPLDLQPESMPTGYAWIRSPDINPCRTRLRLPRYKAVQSYVSDPTPSHERRAARRRITIEQLATEQASVWPSLPPPSLKIQELLEQIDRSGHCHLWTGSRDRDGYGIIHMNGNWKRAHRVVYELAYGPLGPLTIDHQCRVRLCVRLDHLEAVPRGENSKRRWRVRGVAAD
jgi:hypothetical protein